jgi:hypothetical protein
MPYYLPRGRTDQAAYNRELQARFAATRRVAPAEPVAEPDPLAALQEAAELHASGALSDEEFAALKAKLLDTGSAT